MSERLEKDLAVQNLLEAWRAQPIDPAAHGVRDQEQLQSVQRALRGVARARRQRAVRQRVFAGLAVAAGVLAGVGIILSPAVGAVLMSLSTVVVAINARLLKA